MKIFTVLGMVIDKIRNFELGVIHTDTTVEVDFDNTEHLMSLCDIANDNWQKATAVFAKNDRNQRGELNHIVFYNSDDETVVCKVGEGVTDELVTDGMDELYYKICDEIMY